MAVNSSEVNLLVYRYLQESGFSHSAFTFGHESLVFKSTVANADLPPGALISILQKGLQYIEIEAHLNEDGSERAIPEPFALLAPQAVRAHRATALQNESYLKREEELARLSHDRIAGKVVVPECVATLKGHSSEVFICSWNPKLDLLASGSKDSTARLWQVPPGQSGRPAGEVASKTSCVLEHVDVNDINKQHKDVTTLDWSADGALLATGTFDGQARIWTREGSLLSTLTKHTGPIFSLKWNKSGRYLLSGSVDKTTIVWDAQSGTVKQQFKFHRKPTLDVDWRDESCFATCSSDRLIHVCQLGEDTPIATFVGHEDEVNGIKWDPSKRVLASCSDDGTAKLWKIGHKPNDGTVAAEDNSLSYSKNAWVHSFDDHLKEVYTIRWSPCGEGSVNPNKQLLLASASFDSDIMLWDVETMKRVHWLQKHSNPVYSVSFSPDGKYLASGAFDKCLHIWSVKDGTLIKTYRGPGGIFDVSWNASGSKVAAGFSDNSVVVVDLKMM